MNRYTLMKQLVIEEATNLRKYATKAELKRLNIKYLNSGDTTKCIYGQITGHCFNYRAEQLIKNCASRVYDNLRNTPIYQSKIKAPVKYLIRGCFWSPIEVFIDQPRNQKNGNNELLIKFLKGETQELNFK